MKLVNPDLAKLTGRTIIVKHTFWRVDAISNGTVSLTTGPKDTPGRLRISDLAMARLYPTSEEVAKRYPRLIKLLRLVAYLTRGDAENAILGYLTTGPRYAGPESVARLGGAVGAIQFAISQRHLLRRSSKVFRGAVRTSRALIEA